jgi:thiamine-monophosphate kinase
MTVGDLGEFGLIAAIAARLPRGGRTVIGIGDDAAVLATPDGRVVATTDLLVEARHFRRDWSAPADIGGKAAARNLADVAAMGATPVALLVGLATPGDLPVAWAKDLAAGIAPSALAPAPPWSAGMFPARTRSCSRSPRWGTWRAASR